MPGTARIGPIEITGFEGPITIASARAVILGPSNPVISIGPILALAGVKDALAAAPAPVIAVSPFVGGAVLKGPTEIFCEYARIEPRAAGLLDAYAGVLDGVVADEAVAGVPALEVPTLMDTPRRRRALATTIVEFAGSLRRSDPDSA